MRLIEPLLENYGPLLRAQETGAKRVALADNLAVGGTTVSKGVMGEAVRYAHEHQMSLDLVIAPRGGYTPYDDVEIKIMEADVLEAQQLGVDGVIFGALDTNRRLDRDGLRVLVAAAGGMTLTFSTDWDAIRPQDRGGAIDWLATQGFDRLLSAGNPDDRLADWIATKRLVDSAGIMLVPTNVAPAKLDQVAETLATNVFLQSQADAQ